MKRRSYTLGSDVERRAAASDCLSAPEGWYVVFSEPTRNLEQNALLWALLQEISTQVDWHGQKLSSEDWKHIFSSSLKKQRVAPGLDGGFVVLGQSTSKMSKSEFSELIELIYAFGAEHEVKFGTSNLSQDTGEGR